MRYIFKNAAMVRIFINEPSIDPNCAATTALKTNFRKHPRRSVDGLGSDPNFWIPIAPLFTNSYWVRAWIQQEVINATALNIHCCDIILPLSFCKHFLRARMSKYLSMAAIGTRDEKA